tara:strand:+ start:7452 stop:8240 length:789 start_codon:yes stop_codon:yes gene_type:complete
MKHKPKKSLGQNFLVDKNIIKLIIKSTKISKEDVLLEIGPGTGNLTESLFQLNPKKIILIEKDFNLVKKLRDRFKKNVEIVNEDILKYKLDNINYQNMIIFGNLPYNVSSQILTKWIKLENLHYKCKKFIFMFQKEVADRILAKTNEKNYGRLSIFTSWKMDVKKIQDVQPGSFYPVPKVKSTILEFQPKKNYFKINDSKNLEYITSIFFGQKRKMIKKPLNLIFKNSKKISDKLSLNLSDRPQNLSPLTYFKLCKEFENFN